MSFMFFMCAFDNPADACDGNNGHYTVQSKSIKLPIMDIIQMPGPRCIKLFAWVFYGKNQETPAKK